MGNNKYWGNVGVGIFLISTSTKRCLLQLRSEKVDNPYTYGIIGGALGNKVPGKQQMFLSKEEITEKTLKEHLRREFIEEAGNTNQQIKLIKSYIYSDNDFQFHNYIGLIENEFIPIDSTNESCGFIWVDIDGLIMLQNKHFGVEALLDNELEMINKYMFK